MAIACGQDMAAIVKGSQTKVIKMILENRDFALVKIQVNDELTSEQQSAARRWIGTSMRNTVCGIREEGTLYRKHQCDYLLALGKERRESDESREIPWNESQHKNLRYDITTPSLDEFLNFMKGKELFFETYYFEHGGGYEAELVNAFCSDVLLLKRKQDIYLTDDSYQVNVFFQKVADDKSIMPDALTPISINNFAICEQMMESMEKIVWEHYEGLNESDIVLNFETRDACLNASYFLTRFHSNPNWDVNLTNILNLRIAAFLLPGGINSENSKEISEDKLTTAAAGNIYKIDSIHFYSDICYTLSEFEELFDWHLGIIDLA